MAFLPFVTSNNVKRSSNKQSGIIKREQQQNEPADGNITIRLKPVLEITMPYSDILESLLGAGIHEDNNNTATALSKNVTTSRIIIVPANFLMSSIHSNANTTTFKQSY